MYVIGVTVSDGSGSVGGSTVMGICSGRGSGDSWSGLRPRRRSGSNDGCSDSSNSGRGWSWSRTRGGSRSGGSGAVTGMS